MGTITNTPNDSFWVGKKVLVTRHTGFEGSWPAYWLKKKSAQICGLPLDPVTSLSLWDELLKGLIKRDTNYYLEKLN